MRTTMKELIQRERQHIADLARAVHRFEHKMVARLTLASHTLYYGLVAWEAHASYRFAAAGVLALIVLEALPAPKE